MKPEGEDWITANEAAEILHIRAVSVLRIVQRGQLIATRTGTGGAVPHIYLSRREVLARAATRAQKRHNNVRQQRAERQERVLVRLEDYPPQEWITVREAAEILRCSRSQVYRNIAEKRLLSLQNLPGQNSSAHRLSRDQVETYRDSPKRQARVSKYYRSKPIYVPSPQERAEDADPEPMSPWITTEQIMHWLGVSETTVRCSAKAGKFSTSASACVHAVPATSIAKATSKNSSAARSIKNALPHAIRDTSTASTSRSTSARTPPPATEPTGSTTPCPRRICGKRK